MKYIVLLLAFLVGCADAGNFLASNTTPHKLGAPIYSNAGDFIVASFAATPFAIKDGSAVVRATFDTTHGVITAGNGGSDTFSAIGPLTGSEASLSAIWLLNHGITRTGTNPAMYSDNSNLLVNSPNASGLGYIAFYAAGSTLMAKIDPVASLTTLFQPVTMGSTTGANTITGALAVTTRSISTALTVDTTTTDDIIIVDTTSATVAITLPTPTNGRTLHVIDSKNQFAAHNCTLVRHGSENIDNVASTKTLSTAGQRVDVYSDGTNWFTK